MCFREHLSNGASKTYLSTLCAVRGSPLLARDAKAPLAPVEVPRSYSAGDKAHTSLLIGQLARFSQPLVEIRQLFREGVSLLGAVLLGPILHLEQDVAEAPR